MPFRVGWQFRKAALRERLPQPAQERDTMILVPGRVLTNRAYKRCLTKVRFSPASDHTADIPAGPCGAGSGLSQKIRGYFDLCLFEG